MTHNDHVLSEDNVEAIVSILDKRNIFTKPYIGSGEPRATIVGLRIGERPNHVVAYWGDTIRIPYGSSRITVLRLTEVRPERGLTWHTVNPDEDRANEALAYEMEKQRQAVTCQCAERSPGDYTLAIEEGGIQVTHTVCGKSPWFMFDDWTECVSMSPQKVYVSENTRCTGPEHYTGSCDCGPEIYIKSLEGK